MRDLVKVFRSPLEEPKNVLPHGTRYLIMSAKRLIAPPAPSTLNDDCGADRWAMTPSGLRGVVNDAVAIYFRDPALVIGNMARLPSALAQLDRQTAR